MNATETPDVSATVAPVMLRVYHGANKGATAFFRNRPFLDVLTMELRRRSPGAPRVFFHSCSIGAEPYSLALWYLHRAGEGPLPVIEASDIEETFLEVARAGVYPRAILDGMSAEEQSWFETVDDEFVRVPEAARALVRFHPAQSFLEPLPGGPYDAVLAMNSLTYVSPPEQCEAISLMADGARCLLGLSAFHPDTIKRDLTLVGFEPLAERRRDIHEAWKGRRVAVAPLPGTPEYSWQLPPFEHPVEDSEYRFSSLFERAGKAGSPVR